MIDLSGFMVGVQCPGYRCRHAKPASAAGIAFVDFESDGEFEARCQLKRLAPPRRSPLLFSRLVLLASRSSDRELIICISHGVMLDQIWIISGGTSLFAPSSPSLSVSSRIDIDSPLSAPPGVELQVDSSFAAQHLGGQGSPDGHNNHQGAECINARADSKLYRTVDPERQSGVADTGGKLRNHKIVEGQSER